MADRTPTVTEAIRRLSDPVVQRVNFLIDPLSLYNLQSAKTLEEFKRFLENMNPPPELVEMLTGPAAPAEYIARLDEGRAPGSLSASDRLALWDQYATPAQNAKDVKAAEQRQAEATTPAAVAGAQAWAQSHPLGEKVTAANTEAAASNAQLFQDPDTGRLFQKSSAPQWVEVDADGNVINPGTFYDSVTNTIVSGAQAETEYIGGYTDAWEVPNPDLTRLRDEMSRLGKYIDPDAADYFSARISETPETSHPTYQVGANKALFYGKSRAFIAQVQQQLVDAGVMREADYANEAGFWGQASWDAMSQVMDMANASGDTWQHVVRNLTEAMAQFSDEERAALSGTGTGRSVFSAPAYQAPDYATLKEAVRKSFADILGRAPRDYELAIAAQQLSDDYRTQYDAQVGAAQATDAAANRAIDTGEPQAAGTVTQVDPTSRLAETLRGRYSQELDRQQRVSDLHNNFLGMVHTLGGLTNQVTGG